MSDFVSEEEAHHKLSAMLSRARQSDADSCIWEVIHVSFGHNHDIRKMERAVNVTYDSRDEDVARVLQEFMSLVRGKRSRGLIYNAQRFLEMRLSGREFAENVVRNSLQYIQNMSDEAQNLVGMLKEMSTQGKIDYFSYKLSESGVLEYIAWAPKGAKEIVQQYGKDTCSTDSTHNVSKFTLKFWGMLVLDENQHSRPVF